MTKYLLNELIFGFQEQSIDPIEISGISVDSRTLLQGELFVALDGQQVDGHAFLHEAAAKGAAAALVSFNYKGPDCGIPLVRVDNTLRALQEMAKNLLAERKPRIVAITGSVGKTTTKEFLVRLLRKKFRTGYSPGNSNSKVGLPLAVLNHTIGNEEILILEMGMTHPGDISELIQIAPPEVALITTSALVHACNFESIEEIGLAKAEIFSHPHTKLGILDRRIVNYDELIKVGSCRKLSFAVNNDEADFSLDSEVDKMIIEEPGRRAVLSPMPVPGKHNQHNFLAAAAVARSFGMTWEEINAVIPTLILPERRLQIIEKCGALFVNDSYNAAEISIKAALENLPHPRHGGKRIAVIGEMLELGKFSASCHTEVGEHALNFVDHVLCFGKECEVIRDIWTKAGRPVSLFMERSDVVQALKEILEPGDVVLLKGSRAKGLWKVLDEI